MCDIDCRFLACRSFTSKNEKWSGFCLQKKRSYKTYRNTSVMSLFSRTYFQISKYDRRKYC